MRRRASTSVLTAVALLGLGAGGPLPALPGALPAAHAENLVSIPAPTSPQDSAVASHWVNPSLRPESQGAEAHTLLKSVAPALPIPGQPVRLTFELRNDSTEPIRNVSVTPRRASATTSLAQTRQVLAGDRSAYSWAGTPLRLESELPPHAALTMSLDVDLQVTESSTYPTLLEITGTLPDGETVFATERFALTSAVASAARPSAEARRDSRATDSGDAVDPSVAAPGQASSEDADRASQPPPTRLTVIYPISATTAIAPGETGTPGEVSELMLSNESLRDELVDGGRLDGLLDVLEAHPEHAAARCLAIDPELVSVVARMADGYVVGERGKNLVPARERLRDKWQSSDDFPAVVPGTGQEAAQTWLRRLRTQATTTCTVALPWASADINAVARTGNEWLLRQAVARGQATLDAVLGIRSQQGVILPSTGYVTKPAAQSLATSARPLTGEEFSQAWERSATSGDAPSPATPAAKTPAAATAAGEIVPGMPAPEQTAPERDTAEQTAPEQYTGPTRVLIADNTTWNFTGEGRFTELHPDVLGVAYDGSLAAALAATGAHPLTRGYTNPGARFDYRLDSVTARNVTAASALRQASRGSTAPLLVMPPPRIDVATAATLLDTAHSLVDARFATPLSLEQYLALGPEDQARRGGDFGTPFADPTAISDDEVRRAADQARYLDNLTEVLANDPNIALPRFAFSAPLRRDIVRALSVGARPSLEQHDAATAAAVLALEINREQLASLRASVGLIPPGNVYTRASASSPLLIVAENRLPLPVRAAIGYEAPAGASLHLPEDIRIPAAGSLTTSMTAELPEGVDPMDTTTLDVWLSTVDGARISDPVQVAVQTRPGLIGVPGILAGTLGAAFLALLFRGGKKRQLRRAEHERAQAARERQTNVAKQAWQEWEKKAAQRRRNR